MQSPEGCAIPETSGALNEYISTSVGSNSVTAGSGLLAGQRAVQACPAATDGPHSCLLFPPSHIRDYFTSACPGRSPTLLPAALLWRTPCLGRRDSGMTGSANYDLLGLYE
ncbi:hypothetical protein ACRRTK_017744 [Alexandromys fortis]